MTLPDKVGERGSGITLVVEKIGDDVLLSLKGKIQSEVYIPAGILPGVIKALQQIQNSNNEVQSW